MKRIPIFILTIFIAYLGNSQTSEITVEKIYTQGLFYQESVSAVNWMNDGQYYSELADNSVKKVDVRTGDTKEIIVDGSELGISIEGYSFNGSEDKLLLETNKKYVYRRSYQAKYYVYDLKSKKLTELGKGMQMHAEFSPDAKRVAFVKENNLFIKDLISEVQTQVTTDGEFNKIINGGSDWVYEEEFYVTRTFYWSPSGDKIAYYKFDESEVKQYILQRWNNGQLYPENYQYKYPKAGEKNSEISIHIYNLASNKTVNIDLGKEKDIYIPRVQWTKDNELLSITKLNRRQNQLELLHANASTGKASLVLNEESDTYIDINYCDDLLYLDDNKSFIYSSERNGFKHLYQYDMNGKLIKQITDGNWEVETLVGIDQANKKIYYISTEPSPLDRAFYAINLDGKKKTLLSPGSGTTSVNVSDDFKYYISYYSNANTPLQVELRQLKGNSPIKVLKDNERLKEVASKYELSEKEFFQFSVTDNVLINGYMLKPNDFDPSKKYPLLIFQYSGPGSQNVTNSWGGSHFYWHQMLAQKGYIIAYIDPRGTGGRGVEFKKSTYGKIGKLEAEDIISGAKHLAAKDFVDEERVGVWGWSYGGFVSSLCMLFGNDVFKAGITVAMVSNFRFYDTIYTERYLDTPQNNPEGYDNYAPLSHVEKLSGRYLLIHGTGDDNVHVQNTIVFQDALLEKGKQFDLFYYPDRTHGIYEENSYPHLFSLMRNFIEENL